MREEGRTFNLEGRTIEPQINSNQSLSPSSFSVSFLSLKQKCCIIQFLCLKKEGRRHRKEAKMNQIRIREEED